MNILTEFPSNLDDTVQNLISLYDRAEPKRKVYYSNGDCHKCSQKYLPDRCIDLIITDPPYGINGQTLHKHYNRNEEFVIDGYTEIPQEKYFAFSLQWIKQAERVLRPGGCMYIVSGWTNLVDILNALKETKLNVVNHIIWKYNFGVFTTKKFTTSHYHILYCTKPDGVVTFNTNARFSSSEKNEKNGSKLYADMEDVWIINREYKIGKIRHKNELPPDLLVKMIQYSSNAGDVLCDFFAGSFSLAKAAKGMNRSCISFEISKEACKHQIPEIEKVQWGELLNNVPTGCDDRPENQGKAWTEEDLSLVVEAYKKYRNEGKTKRAAIDALQIDYSRGYFSILNALKRKGL